MFDTLQFESSSGDDRLEAGLRDLNSLRVQSYTAHARLVFEVWEHVAYRIFDPAADHLTGRAAVADIAMILGISRASVKAMVDTVQGIGRLPGLEDAFVAGELDYAKVRTIVSVLATGASAETCAFMARRVLRDARQLTPGPLRGAVWAAWLATDTREAEAARANLRREGRRVYVRQGGDSLCWLSACLTDLEGAEAKVLIEELATSVCKRDPRSLDTRRADALMALLHGEGFLRCGCEDSACALATAAPPKRRAHLLQILVDIETLLGLTANPATLPDGSPIDPQVVRTLAEDATWRAILTEMRTLATSTCSGEASTGAGRIRGGRPTPGTDSAADPAPVADPQPATASSPTAARVEHQDTTTELRGPQSVPEPERAPSEPTVPVVPALEPHVVTMLADPTEIELAAQTPDPVPNDVPSTDDDRTPAHATGLEPRYVILHCVSSPKTAHCRCRVRPASAPPMSTHVHRRVIEANAGCFAGSGAAAAPQSCPPPPCRRPPPRGCPIPASGN